MNERAGERVVADGEHSSVAAEQDLLVRDDAGQAYAVDAARGRREAAGRLRRRAPSPQALEPGASAMRRAVRRLVPEGASSLPASWSSTISARS